MKRVVAILTAFLIPALSAAATYDTSSLRYIDVTDQTDGAVAISTLTDMGVLQGNPDGTYRPYDFVNRAEFTKIVMSLVPDDVTRLDLSCFSDVAPSAWYAEPVCRAKVLGIVSGNALAGVSEDQWPFAATRNVNFAEAVKILVEIFDLPVRAQYQDEEWYVRYFEASFSVLGLDTYFDLLNEDITSQENAQWLVTRWEMARLTVDFLAWEAGELGQYWVAEDSQPSSSSSQSSSMVRSSSSVASFAPISSEKPAVSSSSAVYDADTDVSQYTNFLQLGDSASQVLAAVSVFSDAEPLVLNTITITLSTTVSSIDGLLVYDNFGRYLGRAHQDSGAVYKLNIKNSNILVPKREDYSFYIRARIKSLTAGGVSGEDFRVLGITVEGDGDWSNRPYTETSSDTTFPEFQTARSTITSIENAGASSEPLVGGTDQLIGMYRFSGNKADGAADLAVTDITFKLSLIGGVTVSNVELSVQGIGTRHGCSIASSTVTCSSIPDYIGSFEDAPSILELFADVDVPGTAQRATLTANIKQPGSTSSAGSITWTDGSTSFTWVPFGSPVVRGTYYEQ